MNSVSEKSSESGKERFIFDEKVMGRNIEFETLAIVTDQIPFGWKVRVLWQIIISRLIIFSFHRMT
jgi:hypothetical protein